MEYWKYLKYVSPNLYNICKFSKSICNKWAIPVRSSTLWQVLFKLELSPSDFIETALENKASVTLEYLSYQSASNVSFFYN